MHINVSMIQGIWINLSSKLGFNATHVVYIFATYILPGSLHSQWWNHTTWYGWNDHCTPARHVSFFITMYQIEAPPSTSYGGLCSISHKCWLSCFMFIGLYQFSQILKVPLTYLVNLFDAIIVLWEESNIFLILTCIHYITRCRFLMILTVEFLGWLTRFPRLF